MELRQIIWGWDMALGRLLGEAPELARPLRRSCRPIAAERQLDGKLLVVLGCWWQPDLDLLGDEMLRRRLSEALGQMLEDDLAIQAVSWPGGMARPGRADAEEIPPPPLLGGLPEWARQDGERCESPLERWFFARAYARGLQLDVQHVIEHFRVDFALPRHRVAVDIGGWEARQAPRERLQRLGAQRWRVFWFSGNEVHADADRCVSDLLRGVPGAGADAYRRSRLGPRRRL